MPSRPRLAAAASFFALYPLASWLAGWFLLLHTNLRVVLMAQSWHVAQFTPGAAAAVLATGLVFDLVTLALALPALLLLESLLGTRRRAPGPVRLGAVLALAAAGLCSRSASA